MKQDDRLFELHAEVCKTLANPWRLKLIYLLRDGERCLCELVRVLDIPLANVSQHVNIMRARGVVAVRKDGSHRYYRLTSPKIVKASDLMREMLRERLAATGVDSRAMSRADRRKGRRRPKRSESTKG